MIVADPKFPPVTCGVVCDCVCPAGIKTVAGEMLTLEGSLLDKVTVTPPAGAGADNVTTKGADCPEVNVTFEGKLIPPAACTLMLAVASARFGPLARITVEPGATPVTGTLTLVLFCAIVTFAGTVAAPGLSELRLTVTPPAGASPESVRVKFCVEPALTVRVFGEKLREAVVRTTWLVEPKPEAEALIVAVPRLIPVTCGWVVGWVCPAGIKTLVGDTLTLEGSLLESVNVTPPAGAGEDKVTGNGTDWPSPAFTFDGRLTVPKTSTVIFALAPAMLGALVAAVTVAEPTPMPVTGTVMLVVFCGMTTLAGTVAMSGLFEFKVTAKPPAGAGDERVKVRFCEPLAPTVKAPGEKRRVAVTWTV